MYRLAKSLARLSDKSERKRQTSTVHTIPKQADHARQDTTRFYFICKHCVLNVQSKTSWRVTWGGLRVTWEWPTVEGTIRQSHVTTDTSVPDQFASLCCGQCATAFRVQCYASVKRWNSLKYIVTIHSIRGIKTQSTIIVSHEDHFSDVSDAELVTRLHCIFRGLRYSANGDVIVVDIALKTQTRRGVGLLQKVIFFSVKFGNKRALQTHETAL